MNEEKIPFWRNDLFWKIAIQITLIAFLLMVLAILGNNLVNNFQRLRLNFGFDFLWRSASFDIADPAIDYSPKDTYLKALVVGLINSLKIMVSGIFFATVLGIAIGIARLSDNWLVRKIATIYVQVLRNTPLLLQLFFWYFAFFLQLPSSEKSLNLFKIIYLSNQGITIAFAKGTIHLSTEFSALLIGLSLYTAAFIAEVVRAGIQSVNKGQWEASSALGLKPSLTMQLVIFPQALKVMIPPLTSEFLNLAKNSSLAIAIGYNDIYSIANTSSNQTGKAIEMLLIIMLTYLTINLLISLSMNWVNRLIIKNK
jgi:general L-amino acid transport system permease protein